ncbi:chemotaxis protein CheW [Thermithiobacillus tepidarius DSM 3134]|uniref:chemotaxis protein CheW n=1 Tax=Thermithiobacillus tepidarius TaxID=929 RepID=UPI00042751B1|nr:chemotaxis protein CheW [Thermithiobacillus tepidarius]
MEQTAKVQTQGVTQWATFQLDQEKYGVNVLQVQEIIRMTEITPVPGAPGYVLGVINLRGNVVPIISTRERFNLPAAEPTPETRIILVDLEKQVVGIVVDSVAEVVNLEAGEIEKAPSMDKDEWVQFIHGVARRQSDLLILLDLGKLLSED